MSSPEKVAVPETAASPESRDLQPPRAPRSAIVAWSERVTEFVGKAAGFIAPVCLVLMLIVISVHIFARNLLSISVPGSVPIAEMFLAICLFVGIAYAQYRFGHIAVEFTEILLPATVVRYLTATLYVIAGAGFLMLAYFTWGDAVTMAIQGEISSSGGLEFPRAPARFSVSVGFVLNSVVLLSQATGMFAGSTKKQDPFGI